MVIIMRYTIYEFKEERIIYSLQVKWKFSILLMSFIHSRAAQEETEISSNMPCYSEAHFTLISIDREE